eukprot:gene7668-biopygen13611
MTRHDTTRHDAPRDDTTRHDTTRHGMTRHGTARHHTTPHDTTRRRRSDAGPTPDRRRSDAGQTPVRRRPDAGQTATPNMFVVAAPPAMLHIEATEDETVSRAGHFVWNTVPRARGSQKPRAPGVSTPPTLGAGPLPPTTLSFGKALRPAPGERSAKILRAIVLHTNSRFSGGGGDAGAAFGGAGGPAPLPARPPAQETREIPRCHCPAKTPVRKSATRLS